MEIYPNFVLEAPAEVASNKGNKKTCIFYLAWLNCKPVTCMHVRVALQVLRRHYKWGRPVLHSIHTSVAVISPPPPAKSSYLIFP